MRLTPALRPLCALAIGLLWASACRLGGGTEDTNDVQVTGILFERDGTPAREARVVLYPAQAVEVPAESTLTDGRGHFRFPRVPRGS